jgi:hypothetical protein
VTIFSLGPLILAVLYVLGDTAGRPGLAVGVAVASAAALVAFPFAVWRLRRARVQLHERGFRLWRRARRDVAWDQVLAVASAVRPLVRNGVTVAVASRLDLRLQGGERLRIWDVAAQGAETSLHGQLELGAVDAVVRRMQSGAEIRGHRWKVAGRTLEARGERVDLAGLTRATVLEDGISIWTHGERPFLTVPPASANARALASLVERNAPYGVPPSPTAPLGRLLMQRSPARFVPLSMLLFATMLALGLGSLASKGEWSDAAAGAALMAACLWMSVPELALQVRVYELGIVQRSLRGWTRLRFDEVDHVTFLEVRTTNKGYYAGTYVNVRLRREGGPVIAFSFPSRRGGEQDLRDLRGHVVQVVASRMAARLETAGVVAITHKAVLDRSGIRLLDGSDALGYAEVGAWRDEKEHVVIEDRAGAPRLRLPANGEDLLPGLALLSRLVPSARAS